MDIILKPFSLLLTLFYNLTLNYGLALILFACVVKVVLFPFSLKGKKSMVKTSAIQGQAQKIQKQYANNKEKQTEELQKLYAKEGVSPMGGCLWTMLPLFILIPLYAIIRQPMTHTMNMTSAQIVDVANSVLNWAEVSFTNGWTKTAEALTTQTAGQGCNQLYLASLINSENIAQVQSIAPGAMVVNFRFLGMNLAQIPQWKIWTQQFNWNNFGLFLMPLISAALSLGISFVSNKTNAMNNPDNPPKMTATTLLLGPVMSLWIGYVMPAGLCVYWIINSILSIGQEFLSAALLKKDYAAAAEARRQAEIRAAEEEKRMKAALAAERARRAEEKKKQKKKAAKALTEAGVDRSASRVGIRAYARGRNYDPNRFGGVTPYRDPNDLVDEEAIEKARAAKEEKRAEAAEEAEILAAAQAKVDAEMNGETPAEEPAEVDETPAEEAAEADDTPEETPVEDTPADSSEEE